MSRNRRKARDLNVKQLLGGAIQATFPQLSNRMKAVRVKAMRFCLGCGRGAVFFLIFSGVIRGAVLEVDPGIVADQGEMPAANSLVVPPVIAVRAGVDEQSIRSMTLPQSGRVVWVWREVGEDGAIVEKFSVVGVDGKFSEVRDVQPEIMLRRWRFDPTAATPAVPESLRASVDVVEAGAARDSAEREGIKEAKLYIVQFAVSLLPEFRAELMRVGAKPVWFVPHQSWLVRCDARLAREIAEWEFVRAVVPFHPGYRLDEEILDELVAGDALPARRYNIQVAQRGPGQKSIVAERIRQLGGQIDSLTPRGFLLSTTLTANQLLEVVHLDEVVFVDLWGPPGYDMDIVRSSSGGDYVEDAAGYTGIGVRGEVMDGNVLGGHSDFLARPPIFHGPRAGDAEHGTSTYGICFGDGTGNAAGRGMLPDGQGIFADIESLFDRHQHTEDLVNPPYQAVFQSNSWGGSWTSSYTTVSSELDDILFDHDLVLLQSMSNQGNQQARPQAWAKNAVSVGGVIHENTVSRGDDHWTFSASIGPASDGRIKPDLVHFYDSVFTTAADGTYRQFCCTSAATPITAGHFGLFLQMWSDGIFGNEVTVGGTVFENRPHMSTAKAMMVNAAEPYSFTGTSSDLTRTHQGWGLTSVKRVFDRREHMYVVDETEVLAPLGMKQHFVIVQPGEADLRVTMVYTDPAGLAGSAVHRVNDLTLKVISPSQVSYWGNVGLNVGVWSVTGGAPNTRDTVENVFVPNPEPGTWVIEVRADEVNQDGHVETEAIDADYALVVSGARAPSIAGDCDADQDVELTDFSGFFGCFSGPGLAPIEVPCRCIDFDADLDLDLSDWAAFQLRFDCIAPMLTMTPQSGPICPGEEVVLSAAANGNAPLNFQWTKDGEAIAGANGSSYSIASFTPNDAGSYSILVENACGAVTSSAVSITTCAHLFFDSFEESLGWTIVSDPAMTRGQWRREVPVLTTDGSIVVQPGTDYPGGTGTRCMCTGPFGGSSDSNDVDLGPTTVISPVLDLTGHAELRLRYAYWYYRDDLQGDDGLKVYYSGDDGNTWQLIRQHADVGGLWRVETIDLDALVVPTTMAKFKFEIQDTGVDTTLEALIDDVLISIPE